MARRSDHSREEIHKMALDAAEAIIVVEGYKGLSARKVATAIGYTVGTLYLVFENLDDLVLQLNGRTLDGLFDWLVTRRKSGNPQEALIALADAYVAYAEAETPRWNMMFEYVADKGNALPDWYLIKLSKVFGLVEDTLWPLAGHHRSKLELEQAARVLWAGVHGICMLKIRQRMDLAGGQSAEAMAQMLIENFLKGFKE